VATLAAVVFSVVPASPASAAAAFDVPTSDFVGASSTTLTGTKDAGSTLVIRRDGEVACTVSDPAALTWQCSSIAVPSGIHEFTGDETLADGSVVPLTGLTVRVLHSPALDGAGGLVVTTGRFSGTAQPGARIQLSSTGPGGTRLHPCPAAIASGFWSCVADLDSGEYQVRARQSSSVIGPEFSRYSTAVNAVVDRTLPSAPTISSPRAGTTSFATATARGGGEAGALLQLFVDGTLVCETVVSDSDTWMCPMSWPGPGRFTVQALQRDQAGNFSPASDRVEVRFAPPVARPSPNPAPNAPDPAPNTADQPVTPAPSPTEAVPPAQEPPETPSAPLDPVTSNWGTSTGFGGSLPTAAEVITRGGWMLAPLAGLAYLLFIALPLRLFSTHVRPRLAASRPRLTGRNRLAMVTDDTAPRRLSPVLVAAVTLGGAAVIAALSGGIDAEVRYLRLTAAIGLGLVLLNMLGVLLPARIAGRILRPGASVQASAHVSARPSVAVQLLPGILLVALVLALFSRFAGLQPPLLIGILIVTAAALSSRQRVRAAVAAAQTGSVAVLALIGWTAHDLLTPSTGFWMTLWSETAAAMALGGLGSLLFLLLPFGPLPGRALYAVSRPAWAVVALITASLVGAILGSGPAFPLPELMLLAAAFGGVLLAPVVWVRWVAPALR
jgi:hypothetical protein